jgi:hypothetical protein
MSSLVRKVRARLGSTTKSNPSSTHTPSLAPSWSGASGRGLGKVWSLYCSRVEKTQDKMLRETLEGDATAIYGFVGLLFLFRLYLFLIVILMGWYFWWHASDILASEPPAQRWRCKGPSHQHNLVYQLLSEFNVGCCSKPAAGFVAPSPATPSGRDYVTQACP